MDQKSCDKISGFREKELCCCFVCWLKMTGQMGDLRLSGSIMQKSRFIFTKEQRNIRQKSGYLNHSNEQIFQVNIQMQGWTNDFGKGGS